MDQYRMIDGKDFEDSASGFLSFLRKVIYYIARAIKEYFAAVITVFILIAGTGAYFRYTSAGYYEAEMVCDFSRLTKKNYGEMVQALNNLVKTKSYDALASNLHIPVAAASKIISIEGKNMEGSMLYEDITPTSGPLYFIVKASGNDVFAPVQKGLIEYLNTGSPYLIAKTRMDSIETNARISYLSKNISEAGTAIAVIYDYLKRPQFTPDTSINGSRLASLLKYKNELEMQLVSQERIAEELKNSVTILHGFIPPDHPSSGGDKILRLAIIAAVVASCFSAVLLKVLKDDPKPVAI